MSWSLLFGLTIFGMAAIVIGCLALMDSDIQRSKEDSENYLGVFFFFLG